MLPDNRGIIEICKYSWFGGRRPKNMKMRKPAMNKGIPAAMAIFLFNFPKISAVQQNTKKLMENKQSPSISKDSAYG